MGIRTTQQFRTLVFFPRNCFCSYFLIISTRDHKMFPQCGYIMPQQSPTAEECDRIRYKLACVQDPCCKPCPPYEEHKMKAAGMPTASGETVAETLNWKKPVCVNPCDSVPRECVAIADCPPPPPKLVVGPCPPRPQQPSMEMVRPCPPRPQQPPMEMVGPCPPRPQRPPMGGVPLKREDALIHYAGGPQTMASVVLVPITVQSSAPPAPPVRLPPVKLTPVMTSGRTEKAPATKAKYDCDSKTSRRCENDCPECPIEIHNRTVYPKCEPMVPGYGGHVPGITTCKFGKTFGRETREALQKVYSTPRLKTFPKKC